MAAIGCICNMGMSSTFSTLYGFSCQKKFYFTLTSPQGDGGSCGKRMMVGLIQRGIQYSQLVRVSKYLSFRKHLNKKQTLENQNILHHRVRLTIKENEEEGGRPSLVKINSSHSYFQTAAFNNHLVESLAYSNVKAVQTSSRNYNVKIFIAGNQVAIKLFPMETIRYFTFCRNYHKVNLMTNKRNITQYGCHCCDKKHLNTISLNKIQASDEKEYDVCQSNNSLTLDTYAGRKSHCEFSLDLPFCPYPYENQTEKHRETQRKPRWCSVLNLCASAATIAGFGLLIYRFSKSK